MSTEQQQKKYKTAQIREFYIVCFSLYKKIVFIEIASCV